MDGGAWWATVHEVSKSRTRLSDFTFFQKQRKVHADKAPSISFHYPFVLLSLTQGEPSSPIWCLPRMALEKAMAPHSSTLAWKTPWTEEPGGLQSMRSLRVGTTEQLHFHFSLSGIGEGKANPLQCSCLENPRDRGAW